jgi:hypothetical protein
MSEIIGPGEVVSTRHGEFPHSIAGSACAQTSAALNSKKVSVTLNTHASRFLWYNDFQSATVDNCIEQFVRSCIDNRVVEETIKVPRKVIVATPRE